MNEKNHNTDERLEGMLRRWGADESARRVVVPPMPVVSPQRRWLTILLRWGPPSAAAAMLLVAIGLFIAEPPDITIQEDTQSVKTQLAQVQADLQKARAALAVAESRQAKEVERLNNKFAALLKGIKKERTIFLAAAERQITELNRIIGEQKEGLQKVTGELAKTGRELADTKKRYDELVGSKDSTRAKLAAAVSELDRVARMHRKVLAESQKVRADLAAMKVRHKIVLADFQRAYLAAAGGMDQPGRQIGLAVRQSAARRAALLERCAELRPSVQATATGRLMDRLEVVLTRLDLLDPADASDADAFAALVRRGGLVREIDAALSEGGRRADVRTWLLEARLILAGAENVG